MNVSVKTICVIYETDWSAGVPSALILQLYKSTIQRMRAYRGTGGFMTPEPEIQYREANR